MLELVVRLEAMVIASVHLRRSDRLRGEAGQTTAEYALVMLGAAAIAALIVAWASKSGSIAKLFDFAVSKVIGAVK